MEIREKLIQEIGRNIISTKEGPFLQAGAHQFQSFWTRDFCFASLGLSSVGEFDVVKNHLSYLLNNLRSSDGLVARIIESQWSGKTVVLNTVFRFLPYSMRKNHHQKKLKPEYLGEHGTLSIDSNALVIIASFHYAKKSNDSQFIQDHKEKLIKAFRFYENRVNSNLVMQESFEDWQDSVKREGKTFYTNLLYWYAGKLLREAEFISFDIDRIHQSISETFWSQDFYQSLERGSLNSLEGNYLAILFDFHPKENQRKLYDSCEKHQNRFFPYCTQPKYPRQEVSWTTKIVGLRHYHDELHWSWILGLKLAAQRKLNIEDQTHETFKNLLKRDQTIFEIYDESLKPFQTNTYLSEHPFSWGIGIILWALFD